MHKYSQVDLRDLAQEIRHEHAQMHQQLARLEAMASADTDGEGILTSIAHLLEYALDHFMREEGAMHQLRLVWLSRESFADHVEAHADRMERLRHITGMEMTHLQLKEVIAFTRHWTNEHFHKYDAELLRYLPQA